MTAAVEAEPTAAVWTYPYEPLPKQLQAHQIDVDELLYGGAAGGGKALRLDTPVLTPSGWTTHGALRPGDWVYGPEGRPVRVVAVSPVYRVGTYAVTFSNGERIVCSEGHLWAVLDERARERFTRAHPDAKARRRAARPRRGTSDARAAANARRAAAARAGEAAPDVWDYADVVETRALDLTGRKRLAVPYGSGIAGNAPWQSGIPAWAYGMWLGDGSRSSGYIAHGDEDADELIRNMRAVGMTLADRRGTEFKFRTPDGSTIRSVLAAEQGVSGRTPLTKRIPAWAYTTAREDRAALLAGLIDADGHVNARGQVEFCVTDRDLAEDVRRLAATLGYRAGLTEREAAYRKGSVRVVTGTRYTVKFTPPEPVARYERKRITAPRTARTASVYIVSVERVETQETSCIQVDDPRGLYLAGDTLVPTHNSEFLLADAVMFALLVPRSKSILFRTSLPEIEQELEPRLRERVPEAIGRYNGAKHVMRFYNGSTLRFAYLERPGDVYRYTGAEYQRIYFDEATTFDPSNYTFMKSRLRAAGSVLARMEELGLRPAVKSTTNPGGRGHVFFKERFVDPAPPGTVLEDTETGLTRAFIASSATDNPHLNTSYHQFLSALDPQLRKALRDGDWNLLDGVRFSQWRELAHVVTPEEYPIDLTGVPRVVGVDYGVADPFAAVWCALMPDGTVVVYREAVATDMTASEQAEAILQAEGPEERAPGRPLPVVADRSMWNRTGRSGAKRADSDVPDRGSIAWEYYERFGRELRRSVSDRKAGWALVDELLRLRPCDGSCGDDECLGHPRLVIYDTCRNLIKDLPSLPRSKRDPEDAETTGVNDHTVDALRYALMELVARPPRRTKPNPAGGATRKPRPVTSSVRRMGF